MERRDVLAINAQDLEEIVITKDIRDNTTKILAWMADILMPRGVQAVDSAIELLKERADLS